MSHPALKNNFSCLIDGGSLTESGGLPSDSELTSPSGPLRRRRRNPILADGAASDEEPAVGMSDGSSANLMEEPALQRTVSFDDVASLQATPGAPTGLSPAAARLGGRASLDGEVAMDSPTLRMLPSAVLPFREEANGAQTMSARQAPKRTQSELGPETTSAPVTARDPLLFPGQRGPMTPINEISPSMGTPFGGPPPTVAAVATVRRDARAVALPALNAAASVPEEQKWTDFLAAELLPGPSYPTTDVVWGQTERDRVYNALLAVPFQLERLVWLGIALCLDSFLSIFAFLPLRVAGAVATAGLSVLQSGRSGGGARLRGDQLFDMLCAGMFLAVVVFLWHLKAGVIYFWVKELTQEFLKLSVLHTALELGDKVR